MIEYLRKAGQANAEGAGEVDHDCGVDLPARDQFECPLLCIGELDSVASRYALS